MYVAGSEENAITVINSLNKHFENITVSRDKLTGKLSIVKGVPETDDEKAFAKAIKDEIIEVNLNLGDSPQTGFKWKSTKVVETNGAGGFLGNDISYKSKCHDQGNINKIRTLQYLNMDFMVNNYDTADWGMLINHEITESYQGGVESFNTNTPGREYKNDAYHINEDIYLKAHNAATQQPYTIGAKNASLRR